MWRQVFDRALEISREIIVECRVSTGAPCEISDREALCRHSRAQYELDFYRDQLSVERALIGRPVASASAGDHPQHEASLDE